MLKGAMQVAEDAAGGKGNPAGRLLPADRADGPDGADEPAAAVRGGREHVTGNILLAVNPYQRLPI